MSKTLKILIVEDEVLTAIILKRNLEKAGYQVAASVVSGEAAITTAQEIPIDLVLMDIRLAGEMDGIEAAAQIQKIRETTIIFCTGYDDDETKTRALQLEPLAFLNKPLVMATLIHLIDSIDEK